MMGEYTGQPEYTTVAFLSDLFEDWANIEGSEWGELMVALQQLLRRYITVSDFEHAAIVAGWFREEMNACFENNWWDMLEMYRAEIYKAQDQFEPTVARWRDTASRYQREADALEDLIAGMPAWAKPALDREPLPDPELEQYERLKRKFGNG